MVPLLLYLVPQILLLLEQVELPCHEVVEQALRKVQVVVLVRGHPYPWVLVALPFLLVVLLPDLSRVAVEQIPLVLDPLAFHPSYHHVVGLGVQRKYL